MGDKSVADFPPVRAVHGFGCTNRHLHGPEGCTESGCGCPLTLEQLLAGDPVATPAVLEFHAEGALLPAHQRRIEALAAARKHVDEMLQTNSRPGYAGSSGMTTEKRLELELRVASFLLGEDGR